MPQSEMSKTDRIIIDLGKQIVQGKYIPGASLPAETDLCDEFGTSRNIIREVLRALTAKRLVNVQRYRGAFVTSRNEWSYLDSDVLQWILEHDYDPRLIASMNEVRNLVEPTIARLAAERATSTELVDIEDAYNDMVANSQDREAFNRADIRYHQAILVATHNLILQQLGVAFSSLQHAVFVRTYMPDEDNMPRTLREHKELYDAIRHQNIEVAEKAARNMIASSTQRLKESI